MTHHPSTPAQPIPARLRGDVHFFFRACLLNLPAEEKVRTINELPARGQRRSDVMSQLLEVGTAASLFAETHTFASCSTTSQKKKPKTKKKTRGHSEAYDPGQGGRIEAAERHDASPQSPDGPDLGTP